MPVPAAHHELCVVPRACSMRSGPWEGICHGHGLSVPLLLELSKPQRPPHKNPRQALSKKAKGLGGQPHPSPSSCPCLHAHSSPAPCGTTQCVSRGWRRVPAQAGQAWPHPSCSLPVWLGLGIPRALGKGWAPPRACPLCLYPVKCHPACCHLHQRKCLGRLALLPVRPGPPAELPPPHPAPAPPRPISARRAFPPVFLTQSPAPRPQSGRGFTPMGATRVQGVLCTGPPKCVCGRCPGSGQDGDSSPGACLCAPAFLGSVFSIEDRVSMGIHTTGGSSQDAGYEPPSRGTSGGRGQAHPCSQAPEHWLPP